MTDITIDITDVITELQTTVVAFTDMEAWLGNGSSLEEEGNDSVPVALDMLDATQRSQITDTYHLRMFYFTLSVHVFVFLFGGLSNSLFMITFFRYKRLQTTFNIMSFALVANDFVASVFVMPISHALVHYQHRTQSLQTPLCQLNACLLNFVKWNAVLIVTEMAIIRAKVVFATRLWLLKKRTVILIAMANIVASATWAVYRNYFNDINICVENARSEKTHLLTNSGIFLSLFAALLLGYATLAIVTHIRAAAISRRDRGSNKFEIATLRSCAIIVISYTVFHFPYIIYSFLLYSGVTDDQTYYTHSFYVSFFAFVYVADSGILFGMSSTYRKHIGMTLHSLSSSSQSSDSPFPVIS